MVMYTFLFFVIVTVSTWSADASLRLQIVKSSSTVWPANSTSSSTKHRLLTFGLYSEVPETCPARTTCQDICVAQESDCPTFCDPGTSLCADGTCSEECDTSLETPCTEGGCEDLPIACARVVDYLDSCQEKYAAEYEALSVCNANVVEELEQVSFTGPVFLFFYYWLGSVTFVVICWCFFNQKIAPLNESVQILEPILSVSMPDNEKEWTQTGYKKHPVGSFVCFLVWTTLWGFQALLLVLTIFYYMQQEAITRWPVVIHDEVQVLFAFELVWVIGFFWSLMFQWPESIGNLFLRRCSLEEATCVCVYAPVKKVEMIATSRTFSIGDIFVRSFCYMFNILLSLIFSYPSVASDYEAIYCKVARTGSTVPHFYCRMGRYVFSDEVGKYVPGRKSVGEKIGDFLSKGEGLSSSEADLVYNLVGPNSIPIEKPTFFGSVFKEFSKSFYVYQNFMLWTWYPYWYYYMAIIHTVVRLSAGIVVASFQYASDSVLFQLSHVEGNVEVVRDGVKVQLSIENVVPGDIVVLKAGKVCCDLVVIQSSHLIVEESAVTGESNPITKISLDATMSETLYDPTRHKASTLFAGTEILECGDSNDELGLVTKTGSYTMKGQLISDLLSYKRHKFLFDEEIKVVLVILVIQAIIMITVVYQWFDDQAVYGFFYSIFIWAAVIPPLLPTVFVVSVGNSANRLRKRNIHCVNAENVLVAGKVNVCCFDKTGTLTEPGLKFLGVQCGDDSNLENLALTGMAVCHSLKEVASGGMVGNNVDLALFEANASGARHEANVITFKEKKYTILKRFEFDNHRQTQSVVVQDDDGLQHIFVKGSPEAIRSVCKIKTIPKTFEETLHSGTKSGEYQLAIAHKEVDNETDPLMMTRAELEDSLSFCGFLSFENAIKSETPRVMEELKEGNLLITMITGDNVLTGIYVAKKAGMMLNEAVILCKIGSNKQIEWVNVDNDEVVDTPFQDLKKYDLAITGEAWMSLLSNDQNYAHRIARHVRVFGRCNPTHKVSVVTTLVQLGYITMMCGDGQNDCGALKTAHVGIALSSSDASVVASFTSIDKTIGSAVEVLKEGRCALSSAFKAYSYYMMYGQVQAYLQSIAAFLYITFTEWSWVLMDFGWSASLAFSLPLAAAASKLSPTRPTASLFGVRTVSSICGMLALNFFFIVMALVALNQQDWYQCRKWNSDDVSNVRVIGDNYETSTLFIVGGYQYVLSAIALNFGYTYRSAWYTNYVFVFLSTAFTAIQFTITLYPSNISCLWRINCDNSNIVTSVTFGPQPINNAFNTTVMPMQFRLILLVIMLLNLFSVCCWEFFFVNGYLYKVNKFGKDDVLNDNSFVLGQSSSKQ